MRWLKVTLAYDGTDFCGWQVQATGRSLQGTFEHAWSQVTGEAARAVASGRTDAGVHAAGQVVSMRTSSSLAVNVLTRALNANLPADLRVREVAEAPAGFHAIRDACGKRYRYLIQDGGVCDVFARRYCWYLSGELDLPAMRQAAEFLLGSHDFRAFQASGSPRQSTVRELRQLCLQRQPSEIAQLLRIEVEADGFLYRMARNIVGTLVEVGRGKQPPSWAGQVLRSGHRGQGGPTAPPQGLCLLCVQYPHG